ncbi:MAG: HlyD family efflux transporter periplasmic adaptor subunit [Lentisphaerae bacterium]|nr:HlyD family efflux transporter periplasmic adaptor subunit [Lentisphaerota bacterium]
MKNALKLLVPFAVVIIIASGSWWGYKTFFRDKTIISYKTEQVLKEDITSSISASGTVEPEELINVGAQVSGKIMSFGKDTDGNTVDYCSYVKAGSLLAQIDDVLYAAALREAKAQKLQAEAAITSSRASIRQAEAKLNLAAINWKRAQELFNKKAMSKSEYDSAEAAYISAQADSAAARSDLERSNAQLAIAEASLIKAQRNMDYCAITAPVDGIVIDRRVSLGQTVVSSMSASSIFLIAKDLKKMEVWVSVNEADIGHIKPGMTAEFTIDTFPGSIFTGTVKKVRLNATMSQNVVTYIVEVTTDNSDGKLIPYLTANVKFIRDRRKNVLTVSNAALRFQPDENLIAPEFRDRDFPSDTRVVYVKDGEFLRPVEVKTGLTAAGRIELIDPPFAEGDEIVFGATEISAEKSKGDKSKASPFMPKPDNSKVRGGGSAANRARARQSGK